MRGIDTAGMMVFLFNMASTVLCLYLQSNVLPNRITSEATREYSRVTSVKSPLPSSPATPRYIPSCRRSTAFHVIEVHVQYL